MKQYNFNNKTFSLGEISNKKILKFARLFGAEKLSDVPKIFGTNKAEHEQKADVITMDLMIDDEKLFQSLTICLAEPVTREDAAIFDNMELLSEIIADFFSQSATISRSQIQS
jgi:hypothetical protein